jgi:flagellar biosynthesis protein FlhA
MDGVPARDPAFGIPAVWIRSDQAEAARTAGYTVVDPVTVMSTHFSELIRRYAHELFSRQDAKKLLDRTAVDNAKLVEDLVPKLLSLATVQKVFQNLLRERVSIRDAVSILEALGDAGATTRNPVLLTEFVRQSIRRSVVKPYLNKAGELAAYFLGPALERGIESVVEHTDQNSQFSPSPDTVRDLMTRIGHAIPKADTPVAVIAAPGARFFLRQLVETSMPNIYFISHNELPSEARIVSLGTIE